jgi:hypothetical protein
VDKAGYIVIDSSVKDDGHLFFYAKEPKINGNILSYGTEKNKQLSIITFITYQNDIYNNWKTTLTNNNFKSSGLKQKEIGDIVESEDFSSKTVFISTSASKNSYGRIYYEFTFINAF